MCTSTVWVVDDDEDDQLLIRSAFENGKPPVSVLTLNDGAELLHKLAECAELPHLILLDINMPIKNGFETLKELRNIPAYAHVPVVMLTTSSAENERKRALALGANQFLTKPLSFDHLGQLAQKLREQWKLV
ncbi:response regulator [Spirosoma areae]